MIIVQIANNIVRNTGMLLRSSFLKEPKFCCNDIGMNTDIKRDKVTIPNVMIESVAGLASVPKIIINKNPTKEKPYM